MAEEVPLTKLDAVNAMLHDIGDRPVNTLSGSSRLDVTRAIESLEHVSRMIQLLGWWFNEEVITLSVDGSGYYNIPDNVGHVEAIKGGPTTGTFDTPKLVVRGRKLYDTRNATDVFTGAPVVYLKVHRLLEFEDLPASAREYIYASASIRNQSRTVGSANVDRDLRDQSARALSLMREEDIDSEDLDATLAPHFFNLMHNR